MASFRMVGLLVLLLVSTACAAKRQCNPDGTCTETVGRVIDGRIDFFDGVSKRECDWFSCRDYMTYTDIDNLDVYTSYQEWITDDVCYKAARVNELTYSKNVNYYSPFRMLGYLWPPNWFGSGSRELPYQPVTYRVATSCPNHPTPEPHSRVLPGRSRYIFDR